MSKSRQEINRRAAAARRIVLRRLADERPKVYQRWMAEAYQQLDADELAPARRRHDADVTDPPGSCPPSA